MNTKTLNIVNVGAAGLLGLAFIFFGLNHFLNFLPSPGSPPPGHPVALFFGAIAPTGFLTFVKVLEILGGIAVIIPLTRNIGLLILGPIVVNILAFKIFIAGGGLLDPVLIAICVLSAYTLIAQRADFLKLIPCKKAA
jgi:putative oxidoreductase